MRNRPLLIVFTKAPYYGGAKSRLAAGPNGGVGKVHANRIYRAMVRKILRNVTDNRWETVLSATPSRDILRRFGGVWPAKFSRMDQGGGGLTPRLARAFDRKGPTVIIGTDAPQMGARDIAAAFKALKSHAAVFGPADDGGFWLIGVNGPVEAKIFDGARWSTEYALADVAKNIKGECAYLRTLIDVDDVKALAKLKASNPRF
ncbi:MAG: TIGR04282 family arsenosugar biosynthesis glycosyltransferase [Robiginitomaculum sp.]